MSGQSLQRVVVRMLYDEAFLERVYADVAGATEDCDVSDEERRWLCTPDPRAWRVDPLRRSRSLAALVEEFAVSVAMFVRTAPDSTARLDSFFSSDNFHRGMQQGESLTEIFARWFGKSLSAPQREVLRLEAALARVRRARDAGSAAVLEPGTVALASAVEVLMLAGGTMASFSSVLSILREGPVADRALDRNIEVPAASDHRGSEGVLVDGRNPDPMLEGMSAELAAVLALVAQPISVRDFIAEAAGHGADEDDCRSILASFAEDGLVIQA